MYRTGVSNVHWVYVLTSEVLGHVGDVSLKVWGAYDGLDDTCEATTMNAATSVADRLQEVLSKNKSKSNLLNLPIGEWIAVLQELVGRVSGLG